MIAYYKRVKSVLALNWDGTWYGYGDLSTLNLDTTLHAHSVETKNQNDLGTQEIKNIWVQ